MTASASTSANILMGGNFDFGSRWVSVRCVCRSWQNFLGSDRPAGRIRGVDVAVQSSPGDGPRSFAAVAAHFAKVVDFCGFQSIVKQAVAWPASHGLGRGAEMLGFMVPSRIIVRYATQARIDRDRGCPASIGTAHTGEGAFPFPWRAASQCPSRSRRTKIGNNAQASVSTLASHWTFRSKAEPSRHEMGSGVRVGKYSQKSKEKSGFSGARGAYAKGKMGKVAGHVPSDVAVAPMLGGPVNRVN